MVDNNRFLTWKKVVRVRGCTKIVAGNASLASSLMEWETCEHENGLYRPSASEIAGPHYQEQLG